MAIRNEAIMALSNTVRIVIMAKDAAPSVFRALTGATKTQDTPERFRSGNRPVDIEGRDPDLASMRPERFRSGNQSLRQLLSRRSWRANLREPTKSGCKLSKHSTSEASFISSFSIFSRNLPASERWLVSCCHLSARLG